MPVVGVQKELYIFQYPHGPLGLIVGNPAKTPITADSALDPATTARHSPVTYKCTYR